jgi:hypothetical protein
MQAECCKHAEGQFTLNVPGSVITTKQDYPGRVHIGVDGWTSPNVFSFLGITAHRAVDGHIEAFILDFIKCATYDASHRLHLTRII